MRPYIPAEFLQATLRPDNVIPGLLLPNFGSGSELRGDGKLEQFLPSEAFPRVEDIAQLMTFLRRDKDMDVVRRDDKFIEDISIPVEMGDRLGDQVFRLRVFKDHGAISQIQPLLESLREALVILRFLFGGVWLRIMMHPELFLFGEGFEFLLRQ